MGGIGTLSSTCRAIRSGSRKGFAGALKLRSADNFSKPSSAQRGTTETRRNCIRITETHFLKSKAATRFSMNYWVAGIVIARSEFTGRRDWRCMRIKACRQELRSNRLRNSSFLLRLRFLRTSRLRTRRRKKLRLCAWSLSISLGFLCSDPECLTGDGPFMIFEMICK